MLKTSRSSRFKRDFKSIRAGEYGKELDRILTDVLALLLAGQPLPMRYRDHALSGNYSDCRECHLKPDLLLIYRKLDDELIELSRLGSHTQLFD